MKHTHTTERRALHLLAPKMLRSDEHDSTGVLFCSKFRLYVRSSRSTTCSTQINDFTHYCIVIYPVLFTYLPLMSAFAEEGQGGVIGQFDWVLDYGDFSFIFDAAYTRITQPAGTKALVIGCGTSDLSHKLAAHYETIVSVDNDAAVVAHMSHTSRHLAERLKWIVYDMIECYRSPPSSEPYLQPHIYDILVDKCSMDAMLVEGSVAELFYEIHRLLKHNGVFVLCSLHPPSLIEPFLSLPSLQFTLEFCKEVKMESNGECFGTIALCRKKNVGLISYDDFAIEEKDLMDTHYQGIDPWLTPEREAFIQSLHPESRPMSLQEAHSVVCRADSELGYDYDLFISDINNFSLSYEESITTAELISFLRSMQ
jgi:SAM-dependent methyltransferase